MSDPTKRTKPTSGGPAPRGRLDRAPAARYATGADGPAAGSPVPERERAVRAVALAALVALIGGIILFIIGNLDLGAGLLALSAAVGWTTAIALADGRRGAGGYPRGPARIVIAVALATVAAGGAFLALGVYAILEGGVLSPIDYLAQRFGPFVLLDILAAAAAAAFRAR
jgi:hypothetical protein